MSEDRGKTPPSFIQESTSGGSNQTRVRAYNERLVLDLIRKNGSLSKAEIARLCGLTAQTVSVIIRALEADQLLVSGAPIRGKVGQPSVPMSLNPDAAFSIGIKIGRRSIDIVLIDFVGNIRHKYRELYAYPQLKSIIPHALRGIAQIEALLTPGEQKRIAGVGVATPFELWNWAEEVGAPPHELQEWRNIDLHEELSSVIDYPIFMQNDATSACAAELYFGKGAQYPDFLYLFMGSFIGGGIVLNSALFSGRTGTAGAIGPLPIQAPDGKVKPLLKVASIMMLEQELRKNGIDSKPLWQTPEEWHDYGELLDQWIHACAYAIAQATIAAGSLIDFSAIIIDGSFPAWVRNRIVTETTAALHTYDLQGLIVPEVVEGMLGGQARAVGGAAMPLLSRYLLDQNVLFKETHS